MPQEVSASELTFNLGMSNAVIDLTKNGTSQLTVHQKVAATNKCLSSDFWCCIENIKPCIPRARIISVIDGEGKTLLFNGTTGSNQLMITFGSFSSVGTIGAIGFECSSDHSVFVPCYSPTVLNATVPISSNDKINKHEFKIRVLGMDQADSPETGFVWFYVQK